MAMRQSTTPPPVRPEHIKEEREFHAALDRYKRQHRRPNPTWVEVLTVLRGLGWRKGNGG